MRHQSNYLQSSVVLVQRFILSSLLHSITLNTVRSLQSRPFSQLTLEEKLEVNSQKPGTQSTVGLLAAVILEKFIAFLVCFLEMLNEKKLGLSLV